MCGLVKWWSTIPARVRSAATGSCGGSSVRICPGWPSLHARTETVACTVVGGRAVVELLAYVDHHGRELAWPVAVVAESHDDLSVVFRTYCSQWPVDERRRLRPPVLKPGPAHPGDVVGRYQDGLAAGDAEAVVRTFAPDGYFRGPFGPHYAYRGTDELRSFFTRCFSAGGGIALQHCAVTDGMACAARWSITVSAGAATTCRRRRAWRLRARPGRAAGCGPRLRRRRTTRRARVGEYASLIADGYRAAAAREPTAAVMSPATDGGNHEFKK